MENQLNEEISSQLKHLELLKQQTAELKRKLLTLSNCKKDNNKK